MTATITETIIHEEIDLHKPIPCEEGEKLGDCPNEAKWRESHKPNCSSNMCDTCKRSVTVMTAIAFVTGTLLKCGRCGDEVHPADIRFRPL